MFYSIYLFFQHFCIVGAFYISVCFYCISITGLFKLICRKLFNNLLGVIINIYFFIVFICSKLLVIF